MLSVAAASLKLNREAIRRGKSLSRGRRGVRFVESDLRSGRF